MKLQDLNLLVVRLLMGSRVHFIAVQGVADHIVDVGLLMVSTNSKTVVRCGVSRLKAAGRLEWRSGASGARPPIHRRLLSSVTSIGCLPMVHNSI